MTTPEKYETIHNAYYNPNGFGNNAVLLKDAKAVDPTITMKDVLIWRSQNSERTKKMRGYNSYIAPEARYEFQVDLFVFQNQQARPKEETPYGLLGIDSLTKCCWIYPLDKKDVIHWVMGLGFIFEKMGKPQVIYTDPDASMQGNLMTAFLKKRECSMDPNAGTR